MKIRKIIFTIITSFIILLNNMVVYADDTWIILDKSAKKYVKIETNDEFVNMLPGEKRTALIHLKNTSKDTMIFYISGEISENIADKGNKKGIYELKLRNESETEPFYSGKINSKGEVLENELNKEKTDNYYKETEIAKLNENEEMTVVIDLKTNGESMDNSYMNQSGEIMLKILAQKDDTNKKNPVTPLIPLVVNTGDMTSMAKLLAFLIISASVVAVETIYVRYNKKKIK